MTSFSDTLTVGLVLVLLFGSIALYLYTRIQQAEQKISLIESIVLDLKMSAEIKSYSELPASDGMYASSSNDTVVQYYAPYSDNSSSSKSPDDMITDDHEEEQTSNKSHTGGHNAEHNANEQHSLHEYKSAIADAVDEAVKENTSSQPLESINEPVGVTQVNANYEAMTLKELQTLAKSRGITGASSMKKMPIIEALKTSDKVHNTPIESGLLGAVGSNSFLETSSTINPQE